MDIIYYNKLNIREKILLFFIFILGAAYYPVITTLIAGLVLIAGSIQSSNNSNHIQGLIGLLLIIIVFHVIALPYGTVVNGELGQAYLKIASQPYASLKETTSNQPLVHTLLKTLQYLTSFPFAEIKYTEFIIPAIFLRVIVGGFSTFVVYLIQRKITENNSLSITISLLTALLYCTHFYTWLYLHGDQFRNAFGNLFLLVFIYCLVACEQRKISYLYAGIAAVAAVLSHRVYYFIVPLFVMATMVVFVFEKMYFLNLKQTYYQHLRSRLVRINFVVLVTVLSVIIGMKIVPQCTSWGNEYLFLGKAMDIRGFDTLSYTERLLIPAEIYAWAMFVFIVFVDALTRKEHQFSYRIYNILLYFYVILFVLSHAWMYSIDIDLSRLYVLITPIAMLLLVLNLYRLACNKYFSSNHIGMKLFYVIVIIMIIFNSRPIVASLTDGEHSVPLATVFFKDNMIDLVGHIFGYADSVKWQSFILLIGLITFIYFVISIYKFRNHKNIRYMHIIIGLTILYLLPGAELYRPVFHFGGDTSGNAANSDRKYISKIPQNPEKPNIHQKKSSMDWASEKFMCSKQSVFN